MYKLTITLPGLPKPYNQIARQHWAAKKKHADYWKLSVVAACFGKTPKKPLNKAIVKMIRYSSRCPDFDGLVSAGKHLLDGLVNAGVLKDDSMKIIGSPFYLWKRAAPGNGRTEITVIESKGDRE